jgi:hypothetical protein
MVDEATNKMAQRVVARARRTGVLVPGGSTAD